MTTRRAGATLQGLALCAALAGAPAATAQQGATLELACDDAVAVAAGIDVWVNQLPQGRVPLTLRLPTGSYQVVAQGHDGRQWREKVDLLAGESRSIKVLLAPRAPPPDAAGRPAARPEAGEARSRPVTERLGFIGIGFGTGSSYGGIVGGSLEGGFRFLTFFASLGYWPALDLGVGKVPDAWGGELGTRLSVGGRRFKVFASLHWGTGGWGARLGDQAVAAWTFMLGGRVFFGAERRRVFVHAALGVSFPNLAAPGLPTFNAPVTAFDLGFGFDFVGR